MQTFVKRETACWGDVQHISGLVYLQSEVVWHKSNRSQDADFIRTAWLEVEELEESRHESPLFVVRARDQWIRRSGKYAGTVEVSWFQSGTFDRLCDAQMFGDWALERWHAADTFGASGMELLQAVDENGNPTA